MTREDAARIVAQTQFPRWGSVDGMIETMEAFAIVNGMDPVEAHALAEHNREVFLAAQGVRG